MLSHVLSGKCYVAIWFTFLLLWVRRSRYPFKQDYFHFILYKALVLNCRWFCSLGTFGNSQTHFFVVTARGQCYWYHRSYNLQGSPLMTKDYLPENVSSAEVEKLYCKHAYWLFLIGNFISCFFLVVRNALWGLLPLFIKIDTPTYWIHSREACFGQ